MADEWGIEHGYHDAAGTWREPPAATIEGFRAAMTAPGVAGRAEADAAVRLVRQGWGGACQPGDVVLEDGTRVPVGYDLPPDLPLGYHRHETDRGVRPLVVVPGRCHLPDGWRAWGVAVQLYAARSRASWGMGDLADLATVAAWARSRGADVLLCNPLHAVAPVVPQQASPYSPASRRFRNPIYLRVEDVPGAGLAADAVAAAAVPVRSAPGRDPVDRDRVWAAKRAALAAVWAAGGGETVRAEVDAWVAADPAARAWGVWCVLVERHGVDWRSWPPELRDPDGPAVAAVAHAAADEVRFHQWLQWCTEQQLTRATEGMTVVQDLPIGVDRGGFDAWTWQGVLAPDVSVGAPPDAFSPSGQDWGLPPFVPHALRAAAYQPFVETVRATIAGAGGLRIDHVMGLFRLFWIPVGGTPADGTYVRYPVHDLLDLVCLESVRAGAVVVGEDLGTVEDGVRETLADRAILSYKLLWFEPDPPERWPRSAMAAVTTHDLPTVVGLWTGADLAEQRRIGHERDGTEEAAMRDRLASAAGIPADAPAEDAVLGAHRLLATAPCAIVVATLEDAVGEAARPNLPGTTCERPNWCVPLPVPVEDLAGHDLANRVADLLDAAVRRPA